jgi:hypothetical protein
VTSAILGNDELQRFLFELALLSEAHDVVKLLAGTAKSFAARRGLSFLMRGHGNPLFRTFPGKASG